MDASRLSAECICLLALLLTKGNNGTNAKNSEERLTYMCRRQLGCPEELGVWMRLVRKYIRDKLNTPQPVWVHLHTKHLRDVLSNSASQNTKSCQFHLRSLEPVALP